AATMAGRSDIFVAKSAGWLVVVGTGHARDTSAARWLFLRQPSYKRPAALEKAQARPAPGYQSLADKAARTVRIFSVSSSRIRLSTAARASSLVVSLSICRYRLIR